MKITKDTISGFDSATIYFTDSSYTVQAEFISDFCFETKKQRKGSCLFVTDGYIELDGAALETNGTLVDDYAPDEYRVTENLLSRLEEGTDVNRIVFSYKGKYLWLDLPCSPLTDGDGEIVEYSDCPSSEQISDGKRRIYAGQSSKSPKRKNVIYSDVCKNWDEVFGNYHPDLLYGQIVRIRYERDGFGIEFEVVNKRSSLGYFEFWFDDPAFHRFDVHPADALYDILEIELLKSGRVYFCLKDSGICLECGSVAVYRP